MTLATTTSVAGPYNGNGTQVEFPWDFPILAKVDLKVYLTDSTGIDVLQVLDTDYTMLDEDIGVEAGGTVTFVVPPASGYQVTLRREVDATQLVDLVQQGAWSPEVIETALDRAVMLAQQLNADVTRCVKASVTETDPDQTAYLSACQVAQAAAESAQTAAESAESQALGAAASMIHNKNRILNPRFDIWQRSTAVSVGWSSSGYTADQWKSVNNHDAGSVVASRSTTSPDLNFPFSLKLTNSGGSDTSIGASQYCYLTQPLELYYGHLGLSGVPITLSFWARSSKAGTYSVCLHTSLGLCVSEYTLASANTWEFVEITFPAHAMSITGDVSLSVSFILAAGSSLMVQESQIGQWLVGTGKLASPSQVNWLNESSNTFYVTGVQLEAGSTATPFEHRPYLTELQLCQRFYWQAYAFYNDIEYPAVAPYNSAYAFISIPCPFNRATSGTLTLSNAEGFQYYKKSDDTWTTVTAAIYGAAEGYVIIRVPVDAADCVRLIRSHGAYSILTMSSEV